MKHKRTTLPRIAIRTQLVAEMIEVAEQIVQNSSIQDAEKLRELKQTISAAKAGMMFFKLGNPGNEELFRYKKIDPPSQNTFAGPSL